MNKSDIPNYKLKYQIMENDILQANSGNKHLQSQASKRKHKIANHHMLTNKFSKSTITPEHHKDYSRTVVVKIHGSRYGDAMDYSNNKRHSTLSLEKSSVSKSKSRQSKISNNFKINTNKSKNSKSPISDVRRNSGEPKIRKNKNLNTDLCDTYKEPVKSFSNQHQLNQHLF